MNKLLIFASLLCIDTPTRDKLLNLMTGVSQNAYANEPGVLKFALLTPREQPTTPLLYSIEEYASQSAFDSHLATAPVVDMFSWITSANIYQRPALFSTLTSSPDLQFSRPEVVARTADPYVVVRELYYAAGKREQLAMPAWRKVLAVAGNETGMLFFGVYPDAADETHLVVVEGAVGREEWAALRGSEAYGESERVWGASGVGNGTVEVGLEMKGGFLGRLG